MIVETLMTKEPVAAELPGSRELVLKTMVKHKVTGLPVVKKHTTKMLGFITRQRIFANPNESQLALLLDKDMPWLNPEDDVTVAARLFYEKQLHHLPVVDGDELVGVLTPTDLLKVIEDSKNSTPVKEYIITPCVPLFSENPLNVALNIMRLSKIYGLPVLDENARLCGIATDRDIFNTSIIKSSTAISDLGLGEDEDSWTWEGLRNIMKLYYEVSNIDLPPVPIKDIMIPNPVKIFKESPVSDAAKLMRKHDFAQLPVTNKEDRLIGMLYETDIMKALL